VVVICLWGVYLVYWLLFGFFECFGVVLFFIWVNCFL